MINRVRVTTQKISDFNIGAIIRTLLEAVAQEIDELYQQMIHGLIEAIGVSVYSSFDFPALGATSSTGAIRVVVTAPAAAILLGAGSVLTTLDATQSFTSTADVTIASGGTYADVPVAANAPGTAGNLAAGVGFTMAPTPAGFLSASNLAAFQWGTDAETSVQHKARFGQFVQTLARATCPSLVYALLRLTYITDSAGNVTEAVRSAVVDEPYLTDNTQPVGLVNCYIHNGVGSTSAALVARGQAVVDGYYDAAGKPVPGYKAAGSHVVVAAATELPVGVTAAITTASGYDPTLTATAVQQAIYAYILGLPTSTGYLAAQAEGAALAVPGVVNYTPLAMPPAPAAPVLGSSVAGALAAATYYVKVTYTNAAGETVPSAEANLAVAANSVLTVASPAAEGTATGYQVYVGLSAGTETLQTSAPVAIGANWTEPTTGLVAGAVPPTFSAQGDVPGAVGVKVMPGTLAITGTAAPAASAGSAFGSAS